VVKVPGALELLEAYAEPPNRALRRVAIRHVRALVEAAGAAATK